jgi:NAD(P)H-flavin reductase
MIEVPDALGEVVRMDVMLPSSVRIQRVSWETEDIFTLELDRDDIAGECRFSPGQFNMLYAFGIGEAAISVSSDPDVHNVFSHTIHRVGAVTGALAQLRKGQTVGVRGPFGSSWPLEVAQQRDVCIVAGGIGLAPLRPVLLSLFANRNAYGRISLLYGARSPREILYRVELEEWERERDTEVLVTVDRGDSSWKGYIGVVTSLFEYLKVGARETIAYVCGPETMMKFTIKELRRKGVDDDSIYLSLERNMKCGIGLCGHCQYGPLFVCRDGPVFQFSKIRHLFDVREV